MACESIIDLTKENCTKGNLGGVIDLYLLAYKDLTLGLVSGTTNYTTSVSGIINAISIASGITFAYIEAVAKNSVGVSEEMVINSNGSYYLTHTLNFTVDGLNNTNRAFVESVLGQPVVCLVKQRGGSYFATGFNKTLQVSAMTSGTGLAESEAPGYVLTFSGAEDSLLRMVDPSIISSII